MQDDKPKDDDILTIELMWSATFPKFDVPPARVFSMWLRRHPVTTVLAALEHVKQHFTIHNVNYAVAMITQSLADVRYAS